MSNAKTKGEKMAIQFKIIFNNGEVKCTNLNSMFYQAHNRSVGGILQKMYLNWEMGQTRVLEDGTKIEMY